MRIVMFGTGTDVGKTYVTIQLARVLSKRYRVLALKPVESGVQTGVDGDAQRIAAAAGHAAKLSPWRFEPPVSPHLAARQLGISLSVRAICDWVAEQEEGASPAHELTMIETAGGTFSPLSRGVTNLDLGLALGPALWVLVAPDSLGVLHDVTAVLRTLPRPPDAVILSAARPADASSGRNAAELEALGIAQVLGTIGRGQGAESLGDGLWDLPKQMTRI